MRKYLSILCGLWLVIAFQAKAPAQTITNQPLSITVNNASDATFTVGATNATGYQWQLNTTNLSDGGNITGSATPTLTLVDVASNQAGTYTVIITNSVANTSVKSSNAVLTIVPGTVVTFKLTNFLGGGASNLTVQLFDHDKPATVANFIHYITSGAYTNMFFDRCVPGFVLQGGDYGTSNRTDTSSPITGWNISSMFTTASNQPSPPFPQQVDSELGVGTMIHNNFGTLAMALLSGDTNSATCGFFFNLANNTAGPNDLDTNGGGFTVFGRVIDDGTNVLQYYNTLTNGIGLVTDSPFVNDGTSESLPFPPPVNYTGTNLPANANLVYCDFAFLTTPPSYTTLPTVAITSPAPNAVLTNGSTINLAGTAATNNGAGLAAVICTMIPQAAGDGTYPNNGVSVTNDATGTTNWSVLNFETTGNFFGFTENEPMPPGTYELSVQSQDGAGNLSAVAGQQLAITVINIVGNGTVSFVEGVSSNVSPIGYPYKESAEYELEAFPATNTLFYNWSAAGQALVNPIVPFYYGSGFLLTATFISNTLPNSVAFTYPAANAVLSNGTFNITGTISNAPFTPVTVVCQIFSTTTYYQVGPSLTNSGTTNWSVAVASNLPNDSYAIEITATDSRGNTTTTNEAFTVANYVPLNLTVLGNGTVSSVSNGVITNGEYLPVGTPFTVTATPGPGELFYAWNDGAVVATNATQTFTMTSNMSLIAEFISSGAPKAISISYPPAKTQIYTNNFELRGRIASSVRSAQITCQIFSLTAGSNYEVGPPLMTSGTNTWSVAVSNLPPDDYEVEAVATYAGGKTSATSEEFAVLDFKGLTGTYSGLFICNNGPITPTNSGFFTMTLQPSGTFTGKLLMPAFPPYPIDSFLFPVGSVYISSIDYHGNTLALYLSLNLTNGNGELQGTVSSQGWTSELLCYRMATELSTNTPARGKYIFSLNPTANSPGTNGYASLAVGNSGNLTLGGALPDGASFSQSARISTNGTLPLYAVPTGYKTNGMLMGWEYWQPGGEAGSGSYSGQLFWYKGPHLGAYYTNGIVVSNLFTSGTNYETPAATNYTIVFQGGSIVEPVTDNLTVSKTGGQFIPGTNADKLAITLSASGIISGHFVTTNSSKPLQFKGAFLGQSAGGMGFILESNGQTGYFLLNSP